MKYKNILKKQSKEGVNQTCIKKNILDLGKSYSLYMLVLAISLAGIIAIILYAIKIDDDCKHAYSTPNEAVNKYHNFYTTLKSMDMISIEDLSHVVKEWQGINVAVLSCLESDTIYTLISNNKSSYKNIHDSIQQELFRLILSKERNYKDVLLLKEAASSYTIDSIMKTINHGAKPFFSSLDDVPINNSDIKNILKSYRSFLDKCLLKGIHSREDLLAFIKTEDTHFRFFLCHLHELGNDSITDITHKTERICQSISQAVNDSIITEEDAVVYMTIRTNRRLIQNAQQCINDVHHKKIKTKLQAQAYIWMMLQPYSAIDGFGIALLSESDKVALFDVAEETANAIEMLNSGLELGNKSFTELPSLLMRIIIATH